MSRERVERELDELSRLAAASRSLVGDVVALAGRYADTLRGGGTIYFCGNGGSAADAQHVAAEYVVRYARSRRAFAAVALTTDTSILTAAANDFGVEQVFARQVEALCRPGDLLVLHSTSGRSANILAAARAARQLGVATAAFVGAQGQDLVALVDQAIVVPSDATGRVQVMHLVLEHVIVELVEAALPSTT